MKRIGIVPIYGIGDLLLSTPAIRNLKENCLDCSVEIFVISETHKDVLKFNPYIDKIYLFPFTKASKLKVLKYLMNFRNVFDVTINFYPSNRYHYNLFAYILNAPLRVGHRYLKSDNISLNFLKNLTVKERIDRHVVQQNLDLLPLIGIPKSNIVEYPLQYFITEDEVSRAEQFIKKSIGDGLIIGFHPGSSTLKGHINRRWPPKYFADLAKLILKKFKQAKILIFGGVEDEEAKIFIEKEVNDSRVFVINTSNIRETAALIKQCDLFVTNDSGLMHLAAAVQIPIIAIFGPTNYKWVRPWKTKHRIVSLNLPCSPCFYYSPSPLRCKAKLNFKCLRELYPEMVMDAVEDILKG